ncbi:MAG: SPASM domain-containing protein [Syntrophobacteraceae bacterium]|nr:SPASM domain-containing protein [Desulfobacteraceae bacterium]
MEKLLRDELVVKSALELGIGFPIEVPLPPYVAVPAPKPDDSFRVPIAGGQTLCFVTPSGEVAPVTHLDSPERHRYGSLLQDSLKTIWKDEKGIAGFSRERDLSRALCATCPDFSYCRGGRHERALCHWGTWDAHDPWCHFCRQENAPPLPGDPEENERDHGRLPR